MDKTIKKPAIFKETRFRTPGGLERRCGLWVDRIGCGRNETGPFNRLRILGQYAAVAVEEGGGRLLTGTRGRWDVAPGDVLLITPREPHAYGPDESWFTRWIVWNGPEADILPEAGPAGPPVVRGAAPAVRQAYVVLSRLMEADDFDSVLERKAVLLRLMADLVRYRRDGVAGRSARDSLDRVVEYIQQHLSDRPALADLAGMCGVSVPHFRRVFRRHTGRGPMEFVTARRIARAGELLMGGAAIKSAAVQSGYRDPFYFMRVFKKTTGRTAGRFLSDNRGGVI